MKNNKGAIGKMSVSFVATIIIILLLLGFIFISDILKDFVNARNEKSVGENIENSIEEAEKYTEEIYSEIVKARSTTNSDNNYELNIFDIGVLNLNQI